MFKELVKISEVVWVLHMEDPECHDELLNSFGEATGTRQWNGRVVGFDVVVTATVIPQSEETRLQNAMAPHTGYGVIGCGSLQRQQLLQPH